jgi:tryptophan halogenase
MEPLESTSIHLVQSGIARLIQLWPARGVAAADAAEYNRQTDDEWEAIRDFLIFHYHANGRDEPLWRDCRAMDLPDRLRHRIALFRASGRIFREHEELFTELAWLQVMIGQGLEPEAHHPLADALSPAQLDEFLTLAKRQAALAVARFPDHRDFINRHCAAARTH